MMDSPLGSIMIEADDNGITVVEFSWAENISAVSTNSLLNQCAQELSEYFLDNRMFFTVPLSPKGTDFQLRVWDKLRNIPYGETISYLKMAQELGNEKLIRSAASANGKNSIAIIIPCHRVIGANGDLVGYAGGLDKKKWLLEHEGALNKDQFELF